MINLTGIRRIRKPLWPSSRWRAQVNVNTSILNAVNILSGLLDEANRKIAALENNFSVPPVPKREVVDENTMTQSAVRVFNSAYGNPYK